MSLALPKPCVGKCCIGLFAVVGLVSLAVLSVKGITGVWFVCCLSISIVPLNDATVRNVQWLLLYGVGYGGRQWCLLKAVASV